MLLCGRWRVFLKFRMGYTGVTACPMSWAAGQGLLGPSDIAYIVTSTCLEISAIWFLSALLCSPFGTKFLLCLVPPSRPCNISCGSIVSVAHFVMDCFDHLDAVSTSNQPWAAGIDV